jgi:hypothetical protein
MRGWLERPKKPKKPIKKTPSKKRKLVNLEYAALRKIFMLERPRCQVVDGGIRCPNPSTECHHRKGRGRYHIVVESWMAVCSGCHNKIHSNPAWAKENHYLLNRANDEPIRPIAS